MTVKVALLGGFVLALPVTIYQVMMFVAPGLTRREQRIALLIIPAAPLAFAAGAGFAYFVLLPPILGFLLSYGSDIAVPMIRVTSYVNVMVTMVFWMGLVFQNAHSDVRAGQAGDPLSPDHGPRAALHCGPSLRHGGYHYPYL